MARDFRRLKVWREAHEVTLAVYDCTRRFPREEMFGLTSQMRRSAGSIATSIADGCGRSTQADLVRFLDIARGSTSELDYQLTLARDLGYVPGEIARPLQDRGQSLGRMLSAYAARIRQGSQPSAHSS